MSENQESLIERLLSRPVRTRILNVDTGETGEQSVEVPLDLRDALADRIATLERALRQVEEAADNHQGFIGRHPEMSRDGLHSLLGTLRLIVDSLCLTDSQKDGSNG